MLRKSWLVFTMSALLPLNASRGDILVSVDVDPATPGIQSTIQSPVGSSITAGLIVELTGSSSLAIYNFSVQYDRSELTFVSRSETPGVLPGLAELDPSNPDPQTSGLLRRFDGTTFGAGPVAPFGPVKVGEIVFNVTAPVTGASDFDITPGVFETNPLFDQFFNNAGADVTSQVVFAGARVNAVAVIPEPSSLLLLGSSMLACAYRRTRRS